MALAFGTLILQNFLSVGNVPQVIDLGSKGLTLILGENTDVGGTGSRNGVGKTTIVQGLSYALFGTPITGIKKDNLVNATNLKNMQVSLSFSVDGKKYRIERGRKPNFIRWFVGDSQVELLEQDEAQGESKWTQSEIEKVIGFTYDIFTQVIILSTEVTPFLKLGAKDQRVIIEQLLGITQLSIKAEQIKQQIVSTKDAIRLEDLRIRTVIESNNRIKQAIDGIVRKSTEWEDKKVSAINKLTNDLSILADLDIDAELASHHRKEVCTALYQELSTLETELRSDKKSLASLKKELERLTVQQSKFNDATCPTCNQAIHDDLNVKLRDEVTAQITECSKNIWEMTAGIVVLEDDIKLVQTQISQQDCDISTHYRTIKEAYQHKATVDSMVEMLEREANAVNPYLSQIETLTSEGIQEVDYTELNALSTLVDHQEFLHKLLTNKNSFVRKKIIDQNLQYLNRRLAFHLEQLSLPHTVRFMNDLGVEIMMYGREYDYAQLSTGERKRVILGLNWAFRDVWENLNQTVNLLFVDELLDSGTDTAGVEAAWEILTRYARDQDKSVFLISHRDELISRASNVLNVIKAYGFTTFSSAE